VSGLRQAEHLASPDGRGAVLACYYALAYLGFAAPYLVQGLGAVTGKAGAFGVLACVAASLAAWTAGYAIRLSRPAAPPGRARPAGGVAAPGRARPAGGVAAPGDQAGHRQGLAFMRPPR
jgi:hypothetical protein